MKKHRRRSIQSLLSIYFVIFAFLLLALITGLVSWVQYRSARGDAIDTLRQTSMSVADSVDQQINQMSQITLSAISSSSMQDVFVSYISGKTSAYERNQMRTRLAGLLTSARGLDFSIRQLSVYATGEHGETANGYGVGEYSGVLPAPVNSLPWYEDAKNAEGRLVIMQLYDDMSAWRTSSASGFSSIAPSAEGNSYLTVSRMFYNHLHIPVGFVEVRKFYEDVFSLATSLEDSHQASVYIYDSQGQRLFPETFSEDASYFDYYSYAENGDVTVSNDVSGKKEYVSFTVSASNGLIVAAVTESSVFTSQIYRSMTWIVIASVVLFALALLISLLFSRQLSFPIRRIYHFLSDEKKDRFAPLSLEETGIREIDKLTASINDNIRSTKGATETLMTLKEQELQAQMLALQSQMNPHFLYNSLSTIGEMAEEGLTEPVAEMCRQITEILRYISSNREQRTTLEEELEICDMYLDCIRMRYGDQLVSHITVPDEMLEIPIPKLCIQLLVENAIRSVTTAAPPWQVSVNCLLEDMPPSDNPSDQENVAENGSSAPAASQKFWKVTVRDNGPGFDTETDKKLRSQMDYILENGILPSLQIQGMGILNIFIRLYLLDGIPFIFDMGNNPEGGAFVTIGGRVHDEAEETE